MINSPAVQWHIGTSKAALPPIAKGLPVLGNALNMRNDPTRYIVEQYQQLGPIFQIMLFNRPVVVMAGLEANQFAIQEEYTAFSNRLGMEGMTTQMGSKNNILTLDGTPHQHLRKILRRAYSKSQIASHFNTIVGIVDDFLNTLKPGDSFEVFSSLRRLTNLQQGQIMLNLSPEKYYRDIVNFWTINLAVNVFRILPPVAFKTGFYRKAHAAAMEWTHLVLDFTRKNPVSEARPRTAIDDLLEARDENGNPYSEEYLLFEALAPYVAGLDSLTGTASFLVYVLLKNPHILERVLPEIDAVFNQGVPDMSDMRGMETLGKVVHEVLRRYPVTAFMVRGAAQEFEFAGYRVKAGMDIYTAHGVPHFLPEFFPNPYSFDIDRPRPMAGTFLPFGVGNHACLAAGMAEVQVTATVAAIFHRARFSMLPSNFEATMEAIPLPNPGKFRMKLLERRF